MFYKKKSIIYSSLTALFLVISGILFLKVYFIVHFPEDKLKVEITDLFKTYLNKAVKIESVSISFTGNVIVNNLNLSASSDFNDNISLVTSSSTKFSMDLIKLLQKKIVVRGITFYDSKITIIKRYGKDYLETYNQLINISDDIKKLTLIDPDNFTLWFPDSIIIYEEAFKEDKVTITLYDMDSMIRLKSKLVRFYFHGNIKNYQTREIDSGHLDISGECNRPGIQTFDSSVAIDNFDLTYLNRFLLEKDLAPVSLRGGLSCDLDISGNEKGYKLKGNIETNNLHVINLPPSFNSIVSNENINIKVDCNYDKKENNYSVKSCRISDDVMELEGSGNYVNNKDRNGFTISVKSNSINLDELSQNFTPAANFDYSGMLDFNILFDYDLKKNNAIKHDFRMALKDFWMKKFNEGKGEVLIENFNADVTEKNNIINAVLDLKSGTSDFKFKSVSKISEWNPFRSDTEASLNSQELNFSLCYRIFNRIYSDLISGAYEDRKKGYDDVMFLQKPWGEFISNNDISLEYNAKTITYIPGKKKKGLKDFLLGINLKKGVLTLKDFNVRGYDGLYSLEITGFFYRDYPSLMITGSIQNFDVGAFTKENVIGASITGKASLNFEYELNFYRLAHVIDYARAGISLYVQPGTFAVASAQKKLVDFFKNAGYNPVDMTELNFQYLSIAATLSGENFYFNNCSFKSDKLDFSFYGKYNYKGGFNLSGTSNIKVMEKYKDQEYEKIASLPLSVTGRLFAPCLTVKYVKSAMEYCF